MVRAALRCSLLALFVAFPATAEDDGQAIYERECAACHQDPALRLPNLQAIAALGETGVRAALTTGSMSEHGQRLADDELDHLLAFLDDDAGGSVASAGGIRCNQPHETSANLLWAGWGNGSGNARAQTQSGITAGNAERLTLRWAFGFADAIRMRSQPLVTEDTIYIGSQSGTVHALALDSGCERWSFKADAEVRGAVIPSGDSESIFVTDFAAGVYRLDAGTGELQWKTSVADHPTATITGSMAIHDNTLFIPLSSTEVVSSINPDYNCCTFRGGVVALDASSGGQQWRMFTVDESEDVGENENGVTLSGPSGAPVWSTPTIDAERGLVYIGSGQNYSQPATAMSNAVIAVSMASGDVAWHTQTTAGDVWNAGCVTNKVNCPWTVGPDFDVGASVILASTTDNQDILLAGSKSGMVYALDPSGDGRIVWQQRVGRGGKKGGVHWGMTADADTVYVPVGDLPGEAVGDAPAMPGLHALAIDDGESRWYKATPPVCSEPGFECYASFSAAPSSASGIVAVGSMNGNAEIVSAGDGSTLWSYDTSRPFETVNGVTANGGSIDSDGPVIAGDYLIVTSGYDLYGQITGNVLLVFGLEIK